jgi:hypothetical protein
MGTITHGLLNFVLCSCFRSEFVLTPRYGATSEINCFIVRNRYASDPMLASRPSPLVASNHPALKYVPKYLSRNHCGYVNRSISMKQAQRLHLQSSIRCVQSVAPRDGVIFGTISRNPPSQSPLSDAETDG